MNSLGFQDVIKQESSYKYDQNNELNQIIYIYKDQWEGKENGADLKITMTIRDGYDLSLWYYPQEQRYFIKIESSNGTSTDYEYVINEDKFNDGMSPEGMSVEEYLKELYQDPSIDLYREPITIVNKFIDKSFGLDIDQLLKLDPK